MTTPVIPQYILDLVTEHNSSEFSDLCIEMESMCYHNQKNSPAKNTLIESATKVTCNGNNRTHFEYDTSKQEVYELPDGRFVVIAYESQGGKHIFIADKNAVIKICEYEFFSILTTLHIEKPNPA